MISNIPPRQIAAARTVVDSLATMRERIGDTTRAITNGADVTTVRSNASNAIAASSAALDGVRHLGTGGPLDGTTERFANHAARQLTEAVDRLGIPGALIPPRRESILSSLADASSSARLGIEAGERSLARLVAHTRGDDPIPANDSPAPDVTHIDGVRVDNAGNPTRSNGGWSGPDGQRFDDSGTPMSDGGSFSGPDGMSYSGF